MHRPRYVPNLPYLLAAVACALTLAGCSALSGHDVKDAPVRTASTPAEVPSTATATGGGGAALRHESVIRTVLAAAKRNFETIYTFGYRNLDRYRSAGLKVTTAPYTSRYSATLSGPTAQELRTAHEVQVPQAEHAGIVKLGPQENTAVVIVTGKLVTSSSETATPTAKAAAAALHLKRIGRDWRVSGVTPGGRALGAVPANKDLQAAITVTRTCVAEIFGLRRGSFDPDFRRVMGCTTAELHSRLEASKATQLKTLTDGGYDLTSTITGLGVARAGGSSAELVVVLDEYRVTQQGARSGPYPLVFDVIVLRTNGKWLLSAATQMS